MKVTFYRKPFGMLTIHELYEILKIRSEVFIVEQNCPYLDPDGVDLDSDHLYLRNEDEGRIVAYLRIYPRRNDLHGMQIGRVLTTRRGCGYGRRLIEETLREVHKMPGIERVYAEAQVQAQGFYEQFGFVCTSETFLEDGIPHVLMIYHRDA